MVTRCLPLPYVDLVVSRQPKPYFRFLIVGEVGRRRRASRKLWTAMAWTYITVFAGAALQVICETSVTEVPLLRASDCCGEVLTGNGTCLRSTHCGPGCYLRMLDNDTAVCELCDSRSPQQDNFTSCNYTSPPVNENLTTVATVSPQIGGPGVAASLLLGTLLISLLLILSVASFFYLKRSNRLPGLFYRRKKAFIFQPNETAVMISTPTSSVRKPRYVRRERPSVTSASATISTAAVTKVSNV
ncbi:uncharacterized protein C1orf159 homolog isoform X2 [Arapaima gigas]